MNPTLIGDKLAPFRLLGSSIKAFEGTFLARFHTPTSNFFMTISLVANQFSLPVSYVCGNKYGEENIITITIDRAAPKIRDKEII